jgi:chromosome partitioning protein
MGDTTQSTCDVCGTGFEVRFRYQVREEQGAYVYVCSTKCQRSLLLGGEGEATCCAVCSTPVEVEYPYQVAVKDGVRAYFCSLEHRQAWTPPSAAPTPAGREPRRIAVFNHKGGTGKTTTSVNLAAAIAETGRKVLLVDADGQGNVGASLGIRGEKTLYHVLVNGLAVEEAVVPVRPNLDVLTSNEMLAAAELYLAQRPNRDRILRERMGDRTRAWDVVVIDCAPALSLMNQNALVFADGVVVPVACDYLSLVGVRQVLRTLQNVQRHLQHDVELLGVLPTFYDVRNNISRDALTSLQKNFGERCFLPIRVNTKLREAPSAKQTIFEYAPDSHGALDYLKLVERVMPSAARPVPDTETEAPAVIQRFGRPAMSA